MTTIQQKIAERLRSSHTCACDDAYASRRRADPGCARCSIIELEACSVEWGAWDDILGKPEPDLDNVREEARRVFGEGVTVAEYAGFVSVEYVASDRLDPVSAPTIASAYACLRALPSKVTK